MMITNSTPFSEKKKKDKKRSSHLGFASWGNPLFHDESDSDFRVSQETSKKIKMNTDSDKTIDSPLSHKKTKKIKMNTDSDKTIDSPLSHKKTKKIKMNTDSDKTIDSPLSHNKKKKSKHSQSQETPHKRGPNEMQDETNNSHKSKKMKTNNIELSEDDSYSQSKKSKKSKKNPIDISVIDIPSSSKKNTPVQDIGQWQREEVKQLLDNISKHFRPGSKSTYQKELKVIPWKKVIEELSFSKTEEECANKLNDVMRNIKKVRNLHEIISASLQMLPLLSDEGTKKYKPISRLNFYGSLHREDIKKVAEYENIHFFVAQKKLYENCPQGEKDYIEKEINIARKIVKQGKDKSITNPFSIYYNRKKSKFSCYENPYSVARMKYQELSGKKRAKYTSIAVNKIEEEMGKTEESQWPTLVKLNRNEIKDYLHIVLGMPPFPLKSAKTFYFENLPIEEKPTYLGDYSKLWKAVADKEQYEKYVIDRIKEFKEKYPAWLKEHNSPLVEILRLRVYSDEEMEKYFSTDLHTVEMPMSKMKFYDEPQYQSKISGKDMYYRNQTCKGIKIKNLDKEYRSLSKKDKDVYINLLKDIKKKYAERLLSYVQNLNDERRKLYLGFYRRKHISTFSKDIFQTDFPTMEYPIYVSRKVDPVVELTVDEESVETQIFKSFKQVRSSFSDDEFYSKGLKLDISEGEEEEEEARLTPMKINKSKEFSNLKMASQFTSDSNSD